MELSTLRLPVMNEAFLSNRLFEGLSPEVLRSVDIQEMEYQPGDVIFDEGTSGSTLMLVGRGLVQISKTGRQGLARDFGDDREERFFWRIGGHRSWTAFGASDCFGVDLDRRGRSQDFHPAAEQRSRHASH